MKFLSTIIICLIFFLACKQKDEVFNIAYPEGGYPYPTNVDAKDTTLYAYPLKDFAPPFDSIQDFETYFLLKLFDEPNLSLKPQKTTIFRLTYIGWGYSTIINITPSEIIVKKQTKLWRYPLFDKEKLTEKEREDFGNFGFLVEYSKYSNYKKWYQREFDSIVKSKPQLSDLYYYRDLQNKSADAGSQKFEYSIKEIPITNKMFVQLVNMINESGYWKLSHENICDYPPSDASTFILETNTPTKYKYVSSIECPGDTSKYRKACQELINYAGMGKEIKLIWNGAATTAEPVKIKELKLQELKEVQEPISKPKKGKDK